MRVVAATWGSQFASAVAIVYTEVQELSRTADPGEPKQPRIATYDQS